MKKKALVLLAFLLLPILLLLSSGCQQSQQPSSNAISGHVYNKSDGSPFENAVIEVVQKSILLDNERVGNEPTPIPPLYNPHKARTESSADGSYVITDLPSGVYHVTVTAEGCNSVVESVEVTDSSCTTGIDFILTEYSSISGYVCRADNGDPIPGATVLVYGQHGSTGPISATTSADGRYTVSKLYAGESTVGVKADGYAPIIYDGADGTYDGVEALKVITTYGNNTADVNFYLEWGGSISGYIYLPDDYTTVNGAYINYRQIRGELTVRFGGCLPMPLYDHVRSDTTGSYEIGGLLGGDYELWVHAWIGEKTYYSANNLIISVVMSRGTDGVDFILEPGGSITGHIYESDGVTPAQGITITIDGSTHQSIEINQDGGYSFENLKPGDYQIRYQRGSGESTPPTTVTIFSGENTIWEIILPD